MLNQESSYRMFFFCGSVRDQFIIKKTIHRLSNDHDILAIVLRGPLVLVFEEIGKFQV